ncbi:MAG: type II secretion system secretin GspD [Gammaproteobacteria bacterium]|nr:type II secretion system secretin GspD [Gammaproteobacteria bacterium]
MLAPAPEAGPARQEIIETGSGAYTAAPGASASAPVSETQGDITLNFQDVDLREFIKVVLGDVLKENFTMDADVGGRVTIQTARPVRRDELLPLLEQILSVNNAALARTGDMYRILTRQRASRGNLSPTEAGRQGAAGHVLRIIPLQHIAAQEMQKILEPMVPEGSDLRFDKKRNLVIISGSPREIDLVQETVDVFDVDWLRGMSVGLYPLDYVDANSLKSELDSVIGAMEGGDGKELLGGLIRTVAIERLGSLLVIGSTATALREAEIWVRRLDQPGLDLEKRLYVYKVENTRAVEIADILGQIFLGAQPAPARPPAPVLAPGLEPVQITSMAPKPDAPQAAERPRPATAVTAAGPEPSGRDSIQIIADDARNALVVRATPQEYRMVEAAIRQLDIAPLQVLIEASIIEVTLRDDLNYGVEWFFKNNFRHERTGEGQLDLGRAGLAALSPGFAYTIVDAADQVRVALNALAEESEVNVLSSPSLMVLDNQTAMINVGDEIPIPVRQSISNIDPAAPTVNEIQFRQTGVTLSVTPRVGSRGLVTMQIRQEVSNAVSTTTSDIDAPTIQQRQIESTVAINSGDSIILGGLIQDTRTDVDQGIPFLHKIPVIGNLFGQTRDESKRTELLVVLTPRVAEDRNGARRITDEFRRKLRGINLPESS